MQTSLIKLFYSFVSEAVTLSTGEKLRSVLAAFVAIFLVGYGTRTFVSGIALPVLILLVLGFIFNNLLPECCQDVAILHMQFQSAKVVINMMTQAR